jgi:hypothetical protein
MIELYQGGNQRFLISSGGAFGGNTVLNQRVVGDIYLGHGDYPNLPVVIKSNGNVGIGTTGPTERLHVIGNILKSGTVSFVEDYPGDPSRQIVYVSLEGPEVGTYIRGAADCQNNEATIVFPDYFRLVTGENGLTTQLTPRLKSINLYIKELNNEKLVVGCGDAGSFDYLVNGLRKGYENHQVVRSK